MKHPSFFTQYVILLSKELRQEFRTRDMLFSMGMYSILVLVVFGAAISQLGRDFDISQIAGGLVWVLLVFASLLGLGRSFIFEKEGAALDALMLTPLDRSVIYLAKASANLVFLLIVELIVLPLFAFFFLYSQDIGTGYVWALVPVVLGSIGISSVGTLLSCISMNARGRDVLLAVLFIPVAFPLLYAVVGATCAAIVGADSWFETWRLGVVLACAYDIIMTLVAWLLADYVMSG